MTSEYELTIATPSEKEVVLKRNFNAPRDHVFEAYTNPKYVSRWMTGPGGWNLEVCEIDLQVGGKWHYVWRRPEGGEMMMKGIYREIDRPEKLVWTEQWQGAGPENLTTLLLTEAGTETVMTFTKIYPSQEARDAALQHGMREGVAISMKNLEAVVASMAEENR